jgi:hypothetical protein
MSLKIHAICPALNEEVFMIPLLSSLYQFCDGISVITQYDRDWYGNKVTPDSTVSKVLQYPDPEGKIHCVIRRWRDQAAALNSELLALSSEPHKNIQSHGTPIEEIRDFHSTPDYFLIVDADEIYDVETLPNILNYLEIKKPRGMRVTGFQYLWKWNQRIPTDVVHHHHFGFVKPRILFKRVRRVSWNETRLSKALSMLGLPDVSSKVFGFVECPAEVGVFHHGSYLGGEKRLKKKFAKHAHQGEDINDNLRASLDTIDYEYVPTDDLPPNIKDHDWPEGYID